MKYTVHLSTVASLSIDVEVPDDLSPDEAKERAIDEAFQEAPNICAQCSGWGRNFGLDLGDWEVQTDRFGHEVEPEPKI